MVRVLNDFIFYNISNNIHIGWIHIQYIYLAYSKVNKRFFLAMVYLTARTLGSHVCDGLLVFLQHLRQGDVPAFTGDVKH